MDIGILQLVIWIGAAVIIWQGILIGKLRDDVRFLCQWASLVEETLDTQSRKEHE